MFANQQTGLLNPGGQSLLNTGGQSLLNPQAPQPSLLTGAGQSSLLGGGLTQSTLLGGQPTALGGQQTSLLGGQPQQSLLGGGQSTLLGGQQTSLLGGGQSLLGGQQNPQLGTQQPNYLSGGQSTLLGGQPTLLGGQQTSLLSGGQQNSLLGGQQSSLLGGQQSSLLGGQQSSLLGGGQQTRSLYQQPGQQSQVGFSLSSGPSNDDVELRNVLNDFQQALNIQNPTECMLRAPIYDEIPGQMLNAAHMFWNHQYIPTLDANVWNEYQKNNPDPKKFYVSEIRGIEVLQKRMQNNKNLHAYHLNQINDCLKKVDSLNTNYENELRQKIDQVKRKNTQILDKLLTVHGLFEKVAIQFQNYERKPNEEMRLYNKYVSLENVPYQLRSKLMDIKMNLDDIRMRPGYSKTKDEFQGIAPESKASMLDIMEKLKKGIEVLDQLYTKNTKDVMLIQQYIDLHSQR